MNEYTHLDVFSGIGGFSLGFEQEGFRTVAFAEIDPEASLVLRHHWPNVPNLGNIESIDERVLAEIGPIDALTGGVPCQPASALGQMRGVEDERWLWPQTIGLVRKARPRVAVFENPPSILVLDGGRAFNGIASEISALGYDLWWDVIPAAAVGAGHLRERLIIVAADAQGVGKRGTANKAHTIAGGRKTRPISEREDTHGLATNLGSKTGQEISRSDCGVRGKRREGIENNGESDSREIAVADSNSTRLEGHAGNGARNGGWPEAGRPVATPDLRGRVSSERWWHEDVTGIPVLVHGISNRLAEASCRCTGNAVVPQVAQIFARAIKARLDAFDIVEENPPV